MRAILERSEGLRSLGAPAERIVQQIVRAGRESVAEGGTGVSLTPRARRGDTVPAQSTRTVRRDVLHPVRTLKASPSGSGARAASKGKGGGSSQVMKLAGKLMKLIHLAESERRVREAQAQVRLAEDSAEARREGGAGMGGAPQQEQEMNINALQQEVLEHVLRELEMLQARGEDPDGRNNWW